MALQRQRMAAARRVQSQRRLWLRLHDNEQSDQPQVYRKEVLLEPENSSYNEDSEEAKKNVS